MSTKYYRNSNGGATPVATGSIADKPHVGSREQQRRLRQEARQREKQG